MKKLLLVLLSAAMVMCCFAGCSKTDVSGTVKAKIIVEDFGEITLELYADKAPITVQNFVDLANDGFYDGLTFHRVIKNFMIQGGDPKGDGTGGSPNKIKGEFEANGVKNDISHVRGVISMARRSDSYDSASCQFFICHGDAKSLDGQYAAFGRVIEGMDVVDAIAAISVKPNAYGTEMSTPVKPPVIKTVEIIGKYGVSMTTEGSTTVVTDGTTENTTAESTVETTEEVITGETTVDTSAVSE